MDSAMEEEDEFPNADDIVWKEEVNVSQLCRVCANPNEFLIPIFYGEGIEQNLSAKISKHLPIKVTEDDKLPTQLCYQCASTLIAWHDMVVGCLEADEKLKVLIGVEDTEISNEVSADKIGEFESQRLSPDKNRTAVVPSESVRRSGSFGVHKDSAVLAQETSLHNEFEPNGTMSNLVEEASEETSESRNYFLTKTIGKSVRKVYIVNEENNLSDESLEDSFLIKDYLQKKENIMSDRQTMLENVSVLMNDDVAHSVEVYEDVETSIAVDDFGDSLGFIEESEEKLHEEDENIPYICEDCGEVFEGMPAYRSHLSTHLQGHHCSYCDAVYEQADHLKKHIKVTHPEHSKGRGEKKANPYAKSFLCNLCGRILRTKSAYNNHTLKHQSEEPYECSVCTQTFRNKGARRRHEVEDHKLLVKENGNPDGYHVCEVCGMELFSDGAYYHHKDKHGDPHPCMVCGKVYASKTLLQMHMRRHTTERPFVCTICSRTFKVKQELNAHMRMHKDLRPYQCPHCPRTCRKSSDLTHHIRTHTGEKPFVCDACGRGFAQAGDMRKHRQLHSKWDKLQT